MRRRMIAMVLGGGVLLAATATTGALAATSADQTGAVKGAFRRAVELQQTLLAAPHPDQGPPSSSEERSWRSRVTAEIDASYTGHGGDEIRQTLENAIDLARDPDYRYYGGAVSGIDYERLHINGETATVDARVTLWAKLAQVQAGGVVVPATPKGDMLVNAVLTDTPSGWKVSSIDWAFAPGSEP